MDWIEVGQREPSKFDVPEKVYITPKSKGTRNFAQIQEVRTSKTAPSGYIKKYKLKDKSLIAETIDHKAHLRSIRTEN